MGRRKWTHRYKCSHPGCAEVRHHEFETRADLELQLKWTPADKWLCIRHSQTGEVLSAENRVRVTELTCFDEPHGRFWGTDRASNGFTHGPGFRAFADDFPAGTKVRITAELILPEE